MKTYDEMLKLSTYNERLEYLMLESYIGYETFGADRWINQVLYRSYTWKQIRNRIIVRDDGCDMACPGDVICGKIIIHHINPITMEDIERQAGCIFDPNNLVCVSMDTHNAIHFGRKIDRQNEPVIRSEGDTTLWTRRF